MGANTDDSKVPLIEQLPADPFTGLHLHFGMLLGVDDFRLLAGQPRGRHQLHQSWLHGTGVEWGLSTSFVESVTEVRVAPGLAVDGLGRDVHVDEAMCVNLLRWYEAHADDPSFGFEDEGDGVRRFDLHVVAKARVCLARPVPAIADDCRDSDGRDSDYSRALDIAELELAYGLAPPPSVDFPRARLWLGLRAPIRDDLDAVVEEDANVLAAMDEARADPSAARDIFARVLREDVMARGPASDVDGLPTRFPRPEPGAVVLANLLGIRVRDDGEGGFELVDAPTVDQSVRRELLPTGLLQDVLLERATSQALGGPQVVRGSVALAGDELRLSTTAPLEDASVATSAFSVTAFEPGVGYETVAVTGANLDGGPTDVRLTLASAIDAGKRVRLIARGAGATPLLGTSGYPLSGAAGQPSAGEAGQDFVHMFDAP